eukprot:scaffold24260_cov126-Isochrysis_galbana.AAC.6
MVESAALGVVGGWRRLPRSRRCVRAKRSRVSGRARLCQMVFGVVCLACVRTGSPRRVRRSERRKVRLQTTRRRTAR